MQDRADLARLSRALDDAVAALPETECVRHPPGVRRQCREVMLLLVQARERVRCLIEMLAER